MKNRRVFKVLIGFLVITVLFSITVFAKYFTSSDSITNKFGIGSIEVGIAEKFTPKDNWDGNEIAKNVKVENTGKSEELIRVSIIPRWVDENGNPWPGDTSIVKLNLENIVTLDKLKKGDKNLWIDGGDGYYYYSDVLNPSLKEENKENKNLSEVNNAKDVNEAVSINGNNYTSEILSSVSLDMSKLSDGEKARYNGKKLIVDVNTEAIAARKNAIEFKSKDDKVDLKRKSWNIENKSLKAYLEGICKTGDEKYEEN